MVLEAPKIEEVDCMEGIVLEVNTTEGVGCTDKIVLDVSNTGRVEETYTIVLYVLCDVDGTTTMTEDDDCPETSVLDDGTYCGVEEG